MKEKELYYPEWFIVERYKAAASKSHMLKVLAELNGCSKDRIIEILVKSGIAVSEIKQRKKYEERILYRGTDGSVSTASEVAARCGVRPDTVRNAIGKCGVYRHGKTEWVRIN